MRTNVLHACASIALACISLPAVSQPASAPTGTSGLVYKSIKEGSGASPVATDVVRVHYRGTFPDGREFDSSYKRGQPAEFPLNRVIKCWTEGVQKMKVGGTARLVCPPGIAYGESGRPPIPPNATLHFDIELLGIAKP
jgi:FKBP-type peptidyl-prolyl cis-trans isomerase FkpA